MKIVFLDIDGVLNSTFSKACFYDPEHQNTVLGIDSPRVRFLNTIVKASGAKIVLVSDWKEGFEIGAYKQTKKHAQYLSNKLRKYNLKIYDKTYTDIKITQRGVNIIRWLEKHPEVDNYIILDDSFFKYENFGDPAINQHFIKTESDTGLTEEYIPYAIEMIHGRLKGPITNFEVYK